VSNPIKCTLLPCVEFEASSKGVCKVEAFPGREQVWTFGCPLDDPPWLLQIVVAYVRQRECPLLSVWLLAVPQDGCVQ